MSPYSFDRGQLPHTFHVQQLSCRSDVRMVRLYRFVLQRPAERTRERQHVPNMGLLFLFTYGTSLCIANS